MKHNRSDVRQKVVAIPDVTFERQSLVEIDTRHSKVNGGSLLQVPLVHRRVLVIEVTVGDPITA